MPNKSPVADGRVAASQLRELGEDQQSPGALLSAGGSFGFTDADLTDAHWTFFTFDAASSGTAKPLGTLKTSMASDSKGGGAGQINWTYSIADAAIRYLAAGQTLIQKYNIIVDDRHGGTLVKPVTITIVGTNEAPTLVASPGTLVSGAVSVPAGAQSAVGAAGSFAFADADLIDIHTVSATFDPAASGAPTAIGTLTALVSTDATGGQIGQIGWSFAVAAADLDKIDAGTSITQSYNVVVSDGHGGSATQVVAVTLTGTGHRETAPVVTIGLANDTGSSATDLWTSSATLNGTGAANAIVHFSVDGVALAATAKADRAGVWSFTPTGLADGPHTVVASETAAGGTGAATLRFSTDMTAPGTTIGLAVDTGASGTDSYTSNAALTGMGDPNAAVQITIDGRAAGTTSADGYGRWTFSPAGLADGAHVVTASETDVAGNTGEATLRFTLDTAAPAVSIALVRDGTASGGDIVTSNPMVTGSGDAGATVHLAIDGVALTDTVVADSDGSWRYSPAGLAPGAHKVIASETDAAGNTGSASVSFTVQTANSPAPASPVFALAAADQSGPNRTGAGSVTLVGRTSPGDAVTLSTGAKTIASADGTFRFVNVALNVGANDLTATASDGSGQSSRYELVIDRSAGAAAPSMAVQWNRQTLSAIQVAAADAENSSRLLAIESLAVYDVVAGINGTPGYLVSTAAPAGASADAAVAEAAYVVLSGLFPRQTATFAAKLASSLAGIADGQAKTDGIAYGRTVANQLLALRAGDGWNTLVDDQGSTAVGQWRPTAPGFMPGENPQWATLQTFALASPEQFRAPAPPSLTSQAYADAVNKTLSLGASNSVTRTADQTQIAKFWNDGVGSYTPAGHWNDIADTVAVQNGDSLAQDARLLAMLNVAEADAAIAAWDTKYTFNTWRPITVAAEAAGIGNPGITAIPGWTPLVNTPSHPEYVSGHSTFGGAAATILDSVFGGAVGFTIGSSSLGGVTRSFTSFDQAAAEAGESRIYSGIHFEFSNQAGQAIGSAVGKWVLDAFDLTKDIVPPKIVLDQKSGLVTNKAVTLTGSVTDNLSGVASLSVTVDGVAISGVTVGAGGTFSAALGLAVDGTADGPHVAQLVAEDAAGNAASPVSFAFTLDTVAPTITLSAASVQDGGTLEAGSVLAGLVRTETGIGLTALSYAIDGGALVPLAFGAQNDWSQALDLTTLAAGAHTLTLTARDAAGNSTTQTLRLALPSLPPLTIAGLTPMMGASDIGVTYKPQITFSRAVDSSTLTSRSFYATDTTGATIAATIVPTQDGTGAYLFFANPLPGASTITLHVDGSLIRAKADGALLDAGGSGIAGSVATESFTTVSTAPVPNTSISGIVLDPGADLTPMTPDDFTSGPNGPSDFANDTWKLPIAHVKVFILGHEDQAVYTDASGKFTLSSVPTGDVKVVFDGRTATNAPSGLYFPAMTMDTTIRPGIVNTIMGSMGPAAAQAYNAANPAVYLPRVESAILTDLSATAPTVVTVPQRSASGLTSQQAGLLSLTVAPGSLVDANGAAVANAQVGISPVPPQIVMDMLPPGIMQHTFDITIQAPAGAAFTMPAVLTLPNVFNAAPGTKLNILSFDHDTGRLVIDGTGTVSADGLTVSTDPGSGVTKPGWHGMAPPGNVVKIAPPVQMPPPKSWAEITGTLQAEQKSLQGSSSEALAAQVACLAMMACADPSLQQPDANGNQNWVKNVLDGEAQDSADRQNGALRQNASTVLSDLPYLGVGLDYLADYIPNGIPVFHIPFTNVTFQTGDLAAVEQGLGRHFIYELLPYFIQNADHLHDRDPLNPDRYLHDALFDDAIIPCFKALADEGLFSQSFAKLSQTVVPKLAAGLREAIFYGNQGIKLVSNFIDDISGGPRTQRLIASTAPSYTLRASELFSDVIGSAGELSISGAKFFVHVGSELKLQVSLRNIDGSLSNISGSTELNYYAVTDKGTVSIDADGTMHILATKSPLAAVPSILYIVVQDGTKVGVGQFAIVDDDTNGNLLSDSYERLIPPSDLPTTPQATLTALGSTHSQPNAGVYFYAVTDLTTGEVVRGTTDASGRIEGLFLSDQRSFSINYLDPKTLDVGVGEINTGASGRSFSVSGVVMKADIGLKLANGLTSKASFVLGADGTKFDNFVSGMSDAAALQAGLVGRVTSASTTGSVASVPLLGEARSVVSIASQSLSSEITFLATGSNGLALVKTATAFAPKILSQLKLTGGTATDVAVDATLSLAAVATGAGGLQIVDVADPTRPLVVQKVAVNATQVEILDGIAYANDGTSLDAIDLSTGEILQTLALGGSSLTGMAVDGTTLYTMDAGRTLRAIDISGVLMVAKGAITLPVGGQKIFVGGGVAYVGASDGFNGGYATVNVSDPANLKLIEGRDAANIGGAAIALNGSGLGVLVGSPGGVNANNVIDVVNTSDPTKTGQFVTRYTLPSTPYDVAIGEGIAFVADGTSGLQVVNYKAFDTKGVAPTVSITAGPADSDPVAPGIQVVEGARISLAAAIADDVQVRNVEVLINGKPISDDVSYPWQLSAIMPTIAANGSSTVTLQVEAVDTGGNTTVTAPITLQLVRDTTAPTIVSQGVTPGAVVGQSFRAITLSFSKPLDAATVTTGNFFLKTADGSVLTPTSLQLRSDGRVVELTYPVLDVGRYTLELNAAAITDRAGNALGAKPLDTGFTVQPFSEEWKGGTGSWQTAAGWSKGVVPGATDDVLLNLPAGVAVTFSGAYGSTTKIARLAQTNAGTLAVSSGTLDVTGTTNIAGTLQLAGGTFQSDGSASVGTLIVGASFSSGALTGTGDVTVTSALTWTSGSITGSGKLIVGPSATATLGTRNGFYGTIGREIDVAGAATLLAGSIVLGYYDSAIASYVDSPLVIQAGGSLALPTASQIYASNGVGTLTNGGTLIKSGAGTVTSVGAALTNTGTIDIESGTLSSTGAVSNTGTIDIKAGGTLNVSSGVFTLATGSVVKDGGTFVVSGGTLAVADATAAPVFTMTGGRLSGTGDLTIGASLTWSGGSLLGSGKLVVAKAATMTLGMATGGGSESLGRELDLAGTGALTRNSTLYLAAYDSAKTTYVGGTLAVQAGASLTLDTGTTITDNGSTTGALTNAGGLTMIGAGTARMATTATNTGVIDIESGTLQSSGTFTNRGTLDIKSGGLLEVSAGTFTLATGSQVRDGGTLLLSGGTLAVSAATAAPVLRVTSGTLSGTGDLTVGTALAWSGGSMAGNGKTVVGAGATLTIGVPAGGGSEQLGRELDLAGTGTLSRSNTLYLGSYDYDQKAYAGGTLAVQAGASLTFETGSAVLNNGTTTGALTNAGTITKTGAGATTIGVTTTNTGTIDIESGTLTSSASFINRGVLDIKSGGTLNISSDFTLAAGSQMKDGGTLLLSGGTLTVADATTAPVLAITGGRLIGTGDLTVGTSLAWSSGVMADSGRTVVGQGATMVLGAASGGGSEQLGRELDLAGTGTLSQNSTLYLGTYDNDRKAYVSGTLAVQAGGSLTLETGSSVTDYGTTTGTLTNAGSVTKTGTGTTTISVSVANDGTMIVNGGTLQLSGAATTNSGTIDIESGTVLTTGTFTNRGLLDIKSGSTLNVSGDVTLAAGSQVKDGGTLLLSSGKLAVADALAAPVLTLTGGVLSGPGDVTIGTSLAWSGGAMTGSGRTIVGKAATLALGAASGGGSEQLGRALDLAGTGTLTRGSALYLGSYDYDRKAYVSGTLAVQAGGSLTLETDSSVGNYGTTTGALINAGTIAKTGAGTTRVDVALTNSGVMTVGSGTLDLSGAVTGTGLLTIGDGGTLQVEGSVAAGQTVQFAAGTGVLKLSSASAFRGRIAGLTGRDYLDLTGINPANVTIGFLEDPSNSFGTLSVRYGGQTIPLTLAGSYTTSDFAFGSDGAGGLAIALASAGQPIVRTIPGLNSGTLTTDLVIAGAYNWSGGTMAGPGTTTVAQGGALAITNGVYLGRGLDVVGSAAMTDGTLYLGVYDSGKGTYAGGSLAVKAGGSLLVDNRSSIRFNGANTALLSNAGTITKTGPGTATIDVALTNTGTLAVDGGTLSLSGTGTSSGTIVLKAGSTLGLTGGAFTVAAGSQLQASGTVLLSGGTFTIAEAAALSVLTMTYGTLTGTGDVTVGTALTWSGGTMVGTGKTVIAKTATAQLSGGQLGRELDVTGSATMTDSNLYLGVYDSAKSAYVGGTLAIQAGGSLTLDNNSNIYNNGSSSSALTNAGTLTKTGPGTTTISTAVTNAGVLAVADGTLSLSSVASVNSGVIDIKAGATLAVSSGSLGLATGSKVLDSGTLLVSGGTLTIADATALPVLTLTSGTVAGMGAVTVGMALSWSGGTMLGAGKTIVAATGTAQISGGQLGRELDLAGSATMTDSNLNLGAYDSAKSAYVSGTLAILTGGSLTLDNNSNIYNNGSSSSALTNVGTLTKTGPGTATIYAAFTNAGTLAVAAGTMTLNNSASVNTGLIDIQAGATLNLASGTFSLAAGSKVLDSGTLLLSGGTLTTADATALPVLTMTGGTLSGAGDVTVGQALTWSSGVMSGGGKTIVAKGATARFGGGQLGRELDLAGSATLSDSSLSLGVYDSAKSGYVGGTLAIQAGGRLTIDNTSTIQNYGTSTGALSNAGLITKTGPGTTTIGTTVTNTGTIAINAGTLDLRLSSVNAGILDVGGGGRLQVDGDLTGSGTINLHGAGSLVELFGADSNTVLFSDAAAATLRLDKSSAFAGLLQNFGANSTLDLADITGGSASVNYTQGQNGGVLNVTDGSRQARIAFAGTHSLADFRQSADATGGTFIRLQG